MSTPEMMRAVRAEIGEAARSLADAFATDPTMAFFFPGRREARWELVAEFFAILMSARLSLGMPVMVLKTNGRILGAVSGYDTRRLEWPTPETNQWAQLKEGQNGLAGRFKQYDAISKRFSPKMPHYYLGALGTHPSAQGQGTGGLLINAFCALSRADEKSEGVYLDTGNPDNVAFYQRFGFELIGHGELDSKTSLWCLYKRDR
jgi:GNAT superfamily N-acetyltransferase